MRKEGEIDMKSIILAIGAALFAAATSAETRVWKTSGRVNDWNWKEDGNFEGGVAPVAGDTVEVGNTTVKLSDSDTDSFSLVSSLARIKPTHRDATIEITSREGPLPSAAVVCRNGRDARCPSVNGRDARSPSGVGQPCGRFCCACGFF